MEPVILNAKQEKNYITPYAFSVADELIGTPLASPYRRGFAILLDGLFVALLAELNSSFLALIIAVVFFRSSQKLKQQNQGVWRRKFMNLAGALMVFIVMFALIEMLFENTEVSTPTPTAQTSINGAELLTYLPVMLSAVEKNKQGDCNTAECWQSVFDEVHSSFIEQGIAADERKELMAELVGLTELSDTEQQKLISGTDFNVDSSQKPILAEPSEQQIRAEMQPEIAEKTQEIEQQNNTEKPQEKSQPYSLTEWAKGFVTEDLGMSFGWAAVYFSLFTAWWKGQTPGKRLLGIKVVQLDATNLSVWESFERYGGYGAGLATGLLGFVQVFWDANRMAIHDKISETVVIDIKKPKINVAIAPPANGQQ